MNDKEIIDLLRQDGYHDAADLIERLAKERDAAVAFIRHIDQDYGRYINDHGFERWRGPEKEA